MIIRAIAAGVQFAPGSPQMRWTGRPTTCKPGGLGRTYVMAIRRSYTLTTRTRKQRTDVFIVAAPDRA